MESYIEITWISGFFMLMNATTLAFYLSMKPMVFWYTVAYSAIIPLVACILFHRFEWLFMAAVEGFFFYLMYRRTWKSWLIMIAHRLLLNLSAYVLYGGSFHLGVFFVPCDTVPLLLWCSLLLSWFIMFFHLKFTVSKQDFIYPIEVRGNHVQIKTKGYMDSGNLMMSEGIPVMFLDQSYEAYFEFQGIKWVVMDTMQGTDKLPCHLAKARIGSAPYHPVWIHFKKQLSLPLGAKALLNIHMMIQE